ncbi:transposase [Roseiflexus sp.]
MRVPIVCVDPRLRQFASAFADAFSRPQFRHFVTVLVALLLCRGPQTLTGLLRTIRGGGSLASLSRFLSEAPWEATALAAT